MFVNDNNVSFCYVWGFLTKENNLLSAETTPSSLKKLKYSTVLCFDMILYKASSDWSREFRDRGVK